MHTSKSIGAALVALSSLLTAVVVGTLPAAAGGDPQTKTFTYCGTTTWVVPTDVSVIVVDLAGGEGGAGIQGGPPFVADNAPGGLGGRSQANLAVTPGETLTVVVGCAGGDGVADLAAPGGDGHGVGGAGGAGYNAGGAGGGGSAVLRGATPLLVAGGGGGGGADDPLAISVTGGAGGGANQPGGNGGSDMGSCGGSGATTSAPGAGGAAPSIGDTVGLAGNPGSGTDGGAGVVQFGQFSQVGSGGGGGGHFGGGSGGAFFQNTCGGGGGGSGYADPGATAVTGSTGVHEGRGTVSIQFETGTPAAPANDDDAAPVELIGLTGTINGSNVNASREPGEPDHAGISAARSVWYRFAAPFRGRVRLDTLGSDFDTVLAVYTGDPASRSFTPVAANDDVDGVDQSRVTFTVDEGTTYLVAVDGAGGATGSVTLNHLITRPRPDAKVGPNGNDVYNTLTGQSALGGAAPGRSVTHRLRVQNDSALPERLRLQGQASAGAFLVAYQLTDGTDITNRVTQGTFLTPLLAPGQELTVRARVTVNANAGANAVLARTLRARSTVDVTRTDTVRFTTERR